MASTPGFAPIPAPALFASSVPATTPTGFTGSDIFTELPPQLGDESLIDTYGTPMGGAVGEGTYGKVYVTNKNFAVKIMPRFNRQTKRPDINIRKTDLSGLVYPVCLGHPNIIKYHNIYIGTKDITVVMDVYHGDLSHLVTRQPGIFRRMEIFKSLAAQMISAVAYLTSRGIIHLDIKPQNILYQGLGGPLYKFVLADFDLAQDRRCEFSEVKRYDDYYTEPYRPPELFDSHQGVIYNESADVWALGVTLGAVYLGRHLFWNGKNPDEMLSTIAKYVPRGNGPVSQRWAVRLELVDSPLTLFGGNIEVEVFLRRLIQFEPTDRASIFELQYDPFVSSDMTSLIEPNTCIERILYFDRRIDFMPLSGPRFDDIWYKIVSWFLEASFELKFKIQTILLMVELFGRYMLSVGDISTLPVREIQLVGCAAIYLACRYTGTIINLATVRGLANGIYTQEQIIRRCEDLLIRINFDLCAKTPYDEICRFRALYPNKVLLEAVEIVSFSAMYPDMYFQPKNTQVALSIILERNGLQPDRDVSQEEMQKWKQALKTHHEDYVGKLEIFYKSIVQKL